MPTPTLPKEMRQEIESTIKAIVNAVNSAKPAPAAQHAQPAKGDKSGGYSGWMVTGAVGAGTVTGIGIGWLLFEGAKEALKASLLP